jgi:lipopolysaccharide/colanic/teichoic acid biosynthesis glycosyltransferase
VLFKQVRLGKHGRPFQLYKFRSMHHNVDSEIHRQYVQAFIKNQVESERSDGSAPFKLVRDPRITRVGHFIRKTSLDELPQLFNVLLGHMSLVGPRPPLPYEVEAYQDWHRARLEVIPGITGWWQVWGRSIVPFDEMVRMDLEYIARQSLLLDLKILVLTIPAVLFSRGAR